MYGRGFCVVYVWCMCGVFEVHVSYMCGVRVEYVWCMSGVCVVYVFYRGSKTLLEPSRALYTCDARTYV